MVDSIPGDTNMIRISNLSLPIGKDLSDLRKKAAKRLGIRSGDIRTFTPVRQSIDARKSRMSTMSTPWMWTPPMRPPWSGGPTTET